MPRVQKISKFEQMEEERVSKKFSPNFNWFIVGVSLLNLVFMLLISRYMVDPDDFSRRIANFALLFAVLDAIGLFGYYLILSKTQNKGFVELVASGKDLMDITEVKATGATINFLTLLAATSVFEYFIIGLGTFAITDGELAVYYVVASISEEMFFRAFLISFLVLGLKLNKYVAVIISAFAFLIAHLYVYWGNFGMLASVLFGGFCFGYYFVKTENLVGCIVAHLLRNFVATIGIFFMVVV